MLKICTGEYFFYSTQMFIFNMKEFRHVTVYCVMVNYVDFTESLRISNIIVNIE